MEFVELPPAPARRLMRDVWTGAAAQIRRETLEKFADTAPQARPWVCLYSEDSGEVAYRPLLSTEEVKSQPGPYYHPKLLKPVDYRPAVSVRGAFLAQLSVADLGPEFESHVRGIRVFARYVGDGSELPG